MKKAYRDEMRNNLTEKIRESAMSVFPLVLTVAALCIFLIPLNTGLMLSFLIGAVFLIIGIGLFSVGAEQSMTQIGSKIGTALTRTRNMPLILAVSFILGFAITVSEPDLQVLAATVPHISSTVLLVTVGIGVGIFMSLCMFRILTGIKLRTLLIICYLAVFVLAFFTEDNFLGIAFDSGGVTTGPMTVPFILALGIGVANTRSDSRAEADSFGLVALCSIGPIISVLILGFFYSGNGAVPETVGTVYETTSAIGADFINQIPHFLKETAISLLPIVVIFIVFQLFVFRLPKRQFLKTIIGILYTYFGLVLFLTGVNVGFSSLGATLGMFFGKSDYGFLLVPLSAILGWFIISAEPAVGVLEKQIEQVSAGAIRGKTIKLSLSIAVSIATALAAMRVVYGISLMWFLIVGYGGAIILSFFVPDIFTAIAFDSGGVASGPMTATFLLQLVIGYGTASGANVLRDAFGVVALVAMVPLLSIQIVGLVYRLGHSHTAEKAEQHRDTDIIELWEN